MVSNSVRAKTAGAVEGGVSYEGSPETLPRGARRAVWYLWHGITEGGPGRPESSGPLAAPSGKEMFGVGL